MIREEPALDAVQATLFVAEDLPHFVPDAPEVRERLVRMLAKMQAAANWPWKAATVEHYRAKVWPSLLGRLPDRDEATRLKAEMETEASRLDAAD